MRPSGTSSAMSARFEAAISRIQTLGNRNRLALISEQHSSSGSIWPKIEVFTSDQFPPVNGAAAQRWAPVPSRRSSRYKHELARLASAAEQAMDQLYNNDSPAFTTWVIENDLLKEPFVVIDVGVQGGPHPCWKHLKDKVRVYGFDAIPAVIEELNAQKQPNETYFAMALGDEEGTRDFYVRGNGSSCYGSSFYESDALQPGVLSKVPITRLDTLFAKGIIP